METMLFGIRTWIIPQGAASFEHEAATDRRGKNEVAMMDKRCKMTMEKTVAASRDLAEARRPQMDCPRVSAGTQRSASLFGISSVHSHGQRGRMSVHLKISRRCVVFSEVLSASTNGLPLRIADASS